MWDDAAWWSKGLDAGLKIRRLSLADIEKRCPSAPSAASMVKHIDPLGDDDVSISFTDGSSFSGQFRRVPTGVCGAKNHVCYRGEPWVSVQYQSAADCDAHCGSLP